MSREVPSVHKAIRILDLLADHVPDRVPLKQIALALQLPPSTALAICVTLLEDAMITRDARGFYTLGPHAVSIARAYLSGRSPVENLNESLALVPELRAETIVIGVLQGADVVYVACRTGTRPVAVHYQIGMRLPAHCAASGKAMLSLLPESQVLERFDKKDVLIGANGTNRRVSEVMDELKTICKRGYAFDNEELAPGMVCFGAPICDAEGRPIAGVSVGCVKASLQVGDHAIFAEAVQRLAKHLSMAT